MNFVIEHLSKAFEKKQVLKDISFTFESGKIYGLLGRNGAGKTTLFNCLNRDLKTDGGDFFLLEDGGTQRDWRRGYRICSVNAYGSGISHRKGSAEVFSGYQCTEHCR